MAPINQNKNQNYLSGRVKTKELNCEQEHWGVAVAREVIKAFPDTKIHTCAAGISPSGIVHFGNFRDVMTLSLIHI